MPFAHRLLLLLIAVMIGYSAIHAQTSTPAADSALFSFQETVHDFGRVPADTTVEYRFEFVNSGNGMLVINDVFLSCPCFTVDWSRGPVMPGKKGWVSVRYPTTHKAGAFDKIFWIISNAANKSYDPGRFELRIKGEVQAAVISTPESSTGRPAASLPPKHSRTIRKKSPSGRQAR